MSDDKTLMVYTFEFSDTLDNQCDAGILKTEIEADATLGTKLKYVETGDSTIYIYVTDALTDGEEATLKSVIKAHAEIIHMKSKALLPIYSSVAISVGSLATYECDVTKDGSLTINTKV